MDARIPDESIFTPDGACTSKQDHDVFCCRTEMVVAAHRSKTGFHAMWFRPEDPLQRSRTCRPEICNQAFWL